MTAHICECVPVNNLRAHEPAQYQSQCRNVHTYQFKLLRITTLSSCGDGFTPERSHSTSVETKNGPRTNAVSVIHIAALRRTALLVALAKRTTQALPDEVILTNIHISRTSRN